MSKAMSTSHPLRHYNHMADRAAATVVAEYSSSFTLATSLLPPRMRTDIRNLYAVVRVADEIVDGAAGRAGVNTAGVRALLDDFEQAVLASSQQYFHTDPILHAFGRTARHCSLQDQHLRAFFTSMRMDITLTSYSADSLRTYIYGSAEVIGLMCLAIFTSDGWELGQQQRARAEEGAKALGSAFQMINFLRDYHTDTSVLGRDYLSGYIAQLQGTDSNKSADKNTPEPGNAHHALGAGLCGNVGATDAGKLTEETKARLIADIRVDLDRARHALIYLPPGARVGVATALELFDQLTDKLLLLRPEEIAQRRVRLSAGNKARSAARVLARSLLYPRGKSPGASAS